MLRARTIHTGRLTLTPLRVGDSAELAVALDDNRLHEFVGGAPATAADLRRRHHAMLAGPARPGERWLNWVVRLGGRRTAIGTVQATVLPARTWVAWVIGVPWQGSGYATEAAVALVGLLHDAGVAEVAAAVHPEHHASAAVAAAAGLSATEEFADGERVWRRRLTR